MKHTRKSFINLSIISVIFFSSFNFVSKVFASTHYTLKSKRTKGVYEYDKSMQIRKSQDNPLIKTLYKEYLEHPHSHLAHKLLHTHYIDRSSGYKALKEKRILI
ncbi:MAG: iron hydrogenase small subunit [Spirochaetes bacterium]|nr:iron hydrogenase small subunit [Spirochaetota bacterium]